MQAVSPRCMESPDVSLALASLPSALRVRRAAWGYQRLQHTPWRWDGGNLGVLMESALMAASISWSLAMGAFTSRAEELLLTEGPCLMKGSATSLMNNSRV